MTKVLSEIKQSKTCTIESINSNDVNVSEELEILGFTPGTIVKVMNRSLFSGPLTVMLRGAKVAIRQSQAELISVTA